MSSEALKIFTREYATLRNAGLENKSSINKWQYKWANLSFPDGYKPDEDNFKPTNRKGRILSLKDYWRLAGY